MPDKVVEDIVEPLNGSIISGPLEESIIDGGQVLTEPCNLVGKKTTGQVYNMLSIIITGYSSTWSILGLSWPCTGDIRQ